jgi:RNA polymerase sigma-70 factor (ECF subfamily)
MRGKAAGMRDGALIKRILSGDRAAGEQLVREHYASIYRLLEYLLGSGDHVADLTQQTFVKAWRGLAEFRGDASLATWLRRIAYFEYAQWLRARREHPGLDVALEVPDRRSEHQLEAALVRSALMQLSHEHREALVLFHIEGLSIPEIAHVMAVPEGTVKSRLYYGRQRLLALMSEPKGPVLNELPVPRAECETC